MMELMTPTKAGADAPETGAGKQGADTMKIPADVRKMLPKGFKLPTGPKP